MEYIKVKGGSSKEAFDYYPDTCPVCKHAAQIGLVSDIGHLFPVSGKNEETKLQLIFECPRHTCSSRFIVEYLKSYDHNKGGYYYAARHFYPLTPKEFEIVDGIAEISPRFHEIANQSEKAESDGLDEIAGMGFRKALEFLIKDYCINITPDKEAEIKKMPLAQVIGAHVKDQNIKTCASRAAWLGNDEAHYERVWTDHDIKDLKLLIRLTQNWISNERLTAQYLEAMKPKEKA